MNEQRHRRIAGSALGLALGCVYALVSQTINRIALPGIPLHQPPLGPLGNIVLGIVVGGAFGLIAAWPRSAALGILVGSAVAAAAIVVTGLFRAGEGGAATVVAAVFLTVPMAWLTVPVIALARWTADREVEKRKTAAPLLPRLWLPLALVLVVGVLAAFDLHSADARNQMARMNATVQAGLQATNDSALPAPLQAENVRGFPRGTRTPYTLEWTNTDLDRFIELRPATSYASQAAVIARFRGGYTLVCIYSSPRGDPSCGSY